MNNPHHATRRVASYAEDAAPEQTTIRVAQAAARSTRASAQRNLDAEQRATRVAAAGFGADFAAPAQTAIRAASRDRGARHAVGIGCRNFKRERAAPSRAERLRARCVAWLMPFVCAFCVSLAGASTASAADTVRVGVLKFGTVNWELDAVIHNGLDRKHGLKIDIVPFANKQATPIAFFNGSIDLFVSDWLWASRARAEGKKISFIPYSKALGGVIVPPNSKAQQLSELEGARFGVAGGAYDKSWLLLQAWAQSRHQFAAAQKLQVEYAAPPLLNGQIRKDNLDAVLNFWHYCARLESQGYRRLVDMGEVLQGLGIRNTPMVGYLFKEDWARANGDIVERFNRAVREARSLLATDDAEWNRLRPLMKAPDDKMFAALRDGYRKGVPTRWGREDEAAARKLTELFHEIGGETLTKSKELSAGVFWTPAYF